MTTTPKAARCPEGCYKHYDKKTGQWTAASAATSRDGRTGQGLAGPSLRHHTTE